MDDDGVLWVLGTGDQYITGAAPNILMTVALSDAIHLFSAFFESRKKGFGFLDAAKYSYIKNFYPTLLTSITTAIGFGSFYGALVEPVAHLGVMVGIGVIFAWVVTYFFLAPVLLMTRKYFPEVEVEERIKDKKDIPASVSAIKSTRLIEKMKWLDNFGDHFSFYFLASILALS